MALGCGGKELPPKQIPSEAQMRKFMAIEDGNCWMYRTSGSRALSTISVSGPDSRPIAGRDVYIRTFLADSLSKERKEYFDFATAAEMRLARSTEGRGSNAVDKLYATGADAALPLYASFDFGATGSGVVLAETRFMSTATPRDGVAEDHLWTVLGTDEDVALHDGTQAKAFKLSYAKPSNTQGMSQEIATYWFVPEYGVVNFIDFDGEDLQVCGACISDQPGGCTMEQCSSLRKDCNQ
jgi:hypothetical protein